MSKTDTEILSEYGIEMGNHDDHFNGQLLHAMNDYARQERNKAIQEAIDALKENSWFDIFGERANTEITKKLESLKITP